MNTAILPAPVGTLPAGSGILATWALRAGAGLSRWAQRRSIRRTDRDRLLAQLHARAASDAAWRERDALILRVGYRPL